MEEKDILKLSSDMDASWEVFANAVDAEWKYTKKCILDLLENFGEREKFTLDTELRCDGLADPVYVAYDGGNHPEYNSNVFSEVKAIFKKRGKLYLDIEDDSAYPIERLDIFELKGVLDGMMNDIKEKYDIE